MSVIARIDNTKQLSIVGNIVEYPSVLESAGRNLLLKSSFENNFEGWTYSKPSYVTWDTKNTLMGFPTAKIEASGLTENLYSQFMQEIHDADLQEGDLVTFSIYVMSDDVSGIEETEISLMQYDAQGTLLSWGANISREKQVDNEWLRISKTYTMPANIDYVSVRFNLVRNGRIWYGLPKLEKGSTATPWTPAPEDLGLIYPDNVQYFSFGFKSNGDLYTNQVIKSPSQFSMKNDGVTNSITVSEIIENAVLF